MLYLTQKERKEKKTMTYYKILYLEWISDCEGWSTPVTKEEYFEFKNQLMRFIEQKNLKEYKTFLVKEQEIDLTND